VLLIDIDIDISWNRKASWKGSSFQRFERQT